MAGQRFHLVAKDHDEWWMGEIGGRQGLFPAPFVKFIKSAALKRISKPASIPKRSFNYDSLETIFLPTKLSEYHTKIQVVIHNDELAPLNIDEMKALIMLKLNSIFVNTCIFDKINFETAQYRNGIMEKIKFTVMLEFPLPRNYLVTAKNMKIMN